MLDTKQVLFGSNVLSKKSIEAENTEWIMAAFWDLVRNSEKLNL